jgi:hypothetical protein
MMKVRVVASLPMATLDTSRQNGLNTAVSAEHQAYAHR